MEIRQLEYVVEVAKRGSYTKAADALFVSRQGLSKAVKNLESEIGQPLFQGSKGRLVPTQTGGAFVKAAAPVVSSFQNLTAQFLKPGNRQEQHSLSVAIAHGVMLSLPHDAIARFQRANPDILLSIEEVTTEAALDMADEGEADIALVGSAPCYLQDFDALLAVKTGVYLNVPEENPLARHAVLSLESLNGQPFVTTGKRNHLHRFFIEQCDAAGVVPHVIFTTSDIALLVEQAHRQRACYFGFPPGIESRPKEGYVLRPVDVGHEPWFGTYAVKKKGVPLSKAARAFWRYLSHDIGRDGQLHADDAEKGGERPNTETV